MFNIFKYAFSPTISDNLNFTNMSYLDTRLRGNSTGTISMIRFIQTIENGSLILTPSEDPGRNIFRGRRASCAISCFLIHLYCRISVLLEFRSKHGRDPGVTTVTKDRAELASLREEVLEKLNLNSDLIDTDFNL